MYALPNGFLEVRSTIRVQVVGESYHSLDLPEKKRVAGAKSLMVLTEVDAQMGRVVVEPSELFR